MKVIALPYLHEILKPFVDQIYQDKRTVELDPSQLDRLAFFKFEELRTSTYKHSDHENDRHHDYDYYY